MAKGQKNDGVAKGQEMGSNQIGKNDSKRIEKEWEHKRIEMDRKRIANGQQKENKRIGNAQQKGSKRIEKGPLNYQGILPLGIALQNENPVDVPNQRLSIPNQTNMAAHNNKASHCQTVIVKNLFRILYFHLFQYAKQTECIIIIICQSSHQHARGMMNGQIWQCAPDAQIY